MKKNQPDFAKIIPQLLNREPEKKETLYQINQYLRIPKLLLSNAQLLADSLELSLNEVLIPMIEGIIRTQFDSALEDAQNQLAQMKKDMSDDGISDFLKGTPAEKYSAPLEQMQEKLNDLMSEFGKIERVVGQVTETVGEIDDKLGNKIQSG